ELHHEVDEPGWRHPGVVHDHRVRVLDGAGRAGLALEAASQPIGARATRHRTEDLDRDLPVEAELRRAIDDPHPARAELRLDAVALAEDGAGKELVHRVEERGLALLGALELLDGAL